jgi:hypothetical protein
MPLVLNTAKTLNIDFNPIAVHCPHNDHIFITLFTGKFENAINNESEYINQIKG